MRVLDSLWAPFLMTFEGPEAPGHTPGASLCSKGGLDRFLERFWEPNGRPRKPKGGLDRFRERFWEPKWEAKGDQMPPKMDQKINKFLHDFLMHFGLVLEGIWAHFCLHFPIKIQSKNALEIS